MVGRRRFGKKKKVDAPCAPAVPAHRPSCFSYLPSQTCVDLSNQMYICKESRMKKIG
ncbi:hypothetical protein HMPREF0083_04224 [Aneurinibacillus aneurinilyticus ATCC 12856]|uniref:Uncharacterized protein n=1 Tax=Aneurinibacillus aneurinilyticus ATCC 12856 TaxID=649747 RepID=U1WGI0_ANEAE|nr:hypothetical protein HMPREF0083_04224 [Aneurinibacillus aneurinilyticus ATCC 12856]